MTTLRRRPPTTATRWHQSHALTWLVLGFSLFGLVLVADVSLLESLSLHGHPWHFVRQHAIWVALGIACFAVVSRLPVSLWKRWAPVFFLGTLLLLCAVLIPGLGIRVKGAQRWLEIGSFRLQPSELTKLGVVVFFASWLAKHQRFAPFFFLTSVTFLLILLQPNLSTACIVVFLATTLFYLAGGNVKPLLAFGLIGTAIVALLIVAAPYRRERLSTFLNPSSDPLGKSYHIRQITIALGRGGWFGQGIGMSKQKQQYIPETTTDSIFAIYAEETGFLGSLGLLAAYGVLITTGFHIARAQTEPFRFLVAAGITTWFGLHVLLNIAAMAALIPLTGVPLPLVSYGGSAYLSMMIGLGLLNAIQRETTDHQSSGRLHLTRRRRPTTRAR